LTEDNAGRVVVAIRLIAEGLDNIAEALNMLAESVLDAEESSGVQEQKD
jgi:hypothetical protein